MRQMPLSLLALLLASLATLQAQQPDKARFLQVVESRYKSWDTNGDGALESGEVDRLVKSHAVKGGEAAAVASIHLWFRSHPGSPRITLDKIRSAQEDPEERRDTSQKGTHFASAFTKFSKHLAEAPREIFAGQGPSLKGMSQGQLGDCYLISTIGALTHRNPSELHKLIHPATDGSCEIRFAEGRPVHVPKLADGIICLGSNAHTQGLWLNCLEEGAGMVHADPKGVAPADPAIDRVAKGGTQVNAFELLTGRKAEALDLRKTPHQHVHQAMRQAAAEKLLIGAATPHDARHALPPGIPGGHAYAVLSVTPQEVTLWNPWGNQFTPASSPPGPKHGYPVKDGVFTMPFADFAQTFTQVTLETRSPARRR